MRIRTTLPISLIHWRLQELAVQPGSKLERTDALTRCLGFENKNTAPTRILEAEFVLQQLRGEDWKVRKGFSDAGITPFNMERVITKCDLTRYLPSAAPPDNNPSELALTADDAADQIRSISQMSLDAVERVRLVRDVVLRTGSDQRPISPAVADSALRQLADPRLSTYDVLSVSKEIIDVTLTPRKVALPGEGLAPKLFQRNLSCKDNINSVGQVKNLQATNEPTDKKKKKIQDDNLLTIRLRLLSHSSSGRKDYEIVKDTMSALKLLSVPDDSTEASLTPSSPIPSTVALLSPP